MESEAKTTGISANGCVEKTEATTPSLLCIIDPCAWFCPAKLDPRVAALIYWRDVQKSAIVLTTSLLILLSLSCFSLISVFAYTSLLILVSAASFRVYKNIRQAVQKTTDGHPFKDLLAIDATLPADKVHGAVDAFLSHANCALSYLQRIFLVEDLVDSFKFGIYLWALTYIGSWFNGMTLLILAVVALFSLPKAYEVNKTEVDKYLGMADEHRKMALEKVTAMIPMMGGSAKKEE